MIGKRMILIEFARNNNGCISKKESLMLLSKYYANNADKLISAILSRMVHSGHLRRISWGKYELGEKVVFATRKTDTQS